MVRGSENDDTARGVALRASKDRLFTMVAREAAGRGLRALAGGGNVFAIHGLISPRISRAVSFIIAPSDLAALIEQMRSRGWVVESSRRFFSPLPSAIISMTHEGWPCLLRLHSVIPGFFADPESTFDTLWDRRSSTELHGVDVQILDKIATVVFAAHDRLFGDRSRPSTDTSLEFFLDQFQRVLTVKECRQVLDLVQDVGGAQELRPLLEGLGFDTGPTRLPADDYVRQRLALDAVTFADCCLLAYIELPADQRLGLVRHHAPKTLGGVLREIPGGFLALARLRSAPRRISARLGL